MKKELKCIIKNSIMIESEVGDIPFTIGYLKRNIGIRKGDRFKLTIEFEPKDTIEPAFKRRQ